MPPEQQDIRTQALGGRQRVTAQSRAQALGGRLQTPRQRPVGVQPQVAAADLAEPPQPLVLREPQQPLFPQSTQQTIGNVRNQSDEIIRANTEESRQLRELRNESAALGLNGSEIFNQQQERFEVPNNIRELQDINLQLNDLQTNSNLTQAAISGAAGQTLAQGQRELTQEDREFAVRSAGLAARSAILQNNIETGRALARDAANFAVQDRQFAANNLRNQINDLSGVVDGQTAQLLANKQRELDLEDQRIAEVKSAVENAIVAGASQEEIRQLSDPNLDDQTKLQLARSVVGRNAERERAKKEQLQNAQLANIYSQISQRTQAARERQLNAASPDIAAIEKAKADTEQALEVRSLASEILNHPGFNASVGFGVGKLRSAIPGFSGAPIAGTDRADFEALANRLANRLTLENLNLMSGALTDKDIELLASAASNLGNLDQSETQYRSELNRIIKQFDRVVSENGVTPEQAQIYGLAGDADLLEIENIYGTD